MLTIDPIARQSLDFVINRLISIDGELAHGKQQNSTLPFIKRKPN